MIGNVVFQTKEATLKKGHKINIPLTAVKNALHSLCRNKTHLYRGIPHPCNLTTYQSSTNVEVVQEENTTSQRRTHHDY
mgnify:FL=1